MATYFLRPDQSSSAPQPGLGSLWGLLSTVDPGTEATSSPNTGWTVAKVAPTAYDRMLARAKDSSAFFGATVEPSGSPNSGGAGPDSCATDAVLNGTFAAGVWTVTEKVIAVTSGGDQDGNLRFRLWKSANGSSFTELTSGAIDCSTVTNLATGTSQTTSASTGSIGPFTFTNEYLFVEFAWKITGAGGANTRDVIFRVGTGITLVTPTFTAAGKVPRSPGVDSGNAHF